MKKRVFCPVCNCFVESHIETKHEHFNVKGTDIAIDVQVRACNTCGESLFDEELDELAIQQAYAIYREEKKLLSPERIKAIRERYQLSQTAFAKVLGLGEKTIARYETGSLPDEAQSNLILLMEDAACFRKLLWRNMDRLKQAEMATAVAACEPKRISYAFDFRKEGDSFSGAWSYEPEKLVIG